MKKVIVFLSLVLGMSAFAEGGAAQLSEDAKLAILIADTNQVAELSVSTDVSQLKSIKSIDGDESSSSIVKINVYGQERTYVITRDGGGQVLNIQLQSK